MRDIPSKIASCDEQPSLVLNAFPKIILSHKPRYYSRISGPEKSCNNTREKKSYFFTCVDIANQLLTRHSPLATLGQVNKCTAKPSRF